MGILRKVRVAVWGEPPATKAESYLLFKIDWFILSYVCLMYWVNYLDRANLNNAYVSGAREDLGFQGTQLNQINTIFYGGYLLGQIPNNLILQKVPPRIWLPTTCLCWGLLTLGTGFTHHPWQIMVIRFFQGFFEASCFVGVHWILGSWYKPDEIGKRTAIFTSSGLAGTLFSGIMQGAIFKNLNGVSGLAGWRWLFIIDFLITFPVAIYGFLFFPDTPNSTTAKYLTPEERTLAVERLPEVAKQRGVLGWSLIGRVVLSWQWWGFVLLWIAGSNTEMWSSNAIMQLWLKSGDAGTYTIPQVNYIPSSVSGLGIVATLALGWYSDYNIRHRWHVGVFLSITAVISGALMLSPPSRASKFAALILNGCQYAGQTVFFAWANDLTRQDDAKRSVVIASMNMFSVAVYLFWSLLFYNTTQAPNWYEGSCAMIAMGVFLLIMTIVCYLLQRRQEKQELSQTMGWDMDDAKPTQSVTAEKA
ncbi:Putative major facilitator superfamily, MFS transporter superfamily [Septoria linicola]|uniref:Major facilitator superfamily, MFS transporter superfamily n=1 Tax=Septoria linicola TaxID=215465 RepID=A0A9Q9AKG6_9PEZI|nr:putative major facilitator superfamily, MFS transporter superfamily [Septoria linicola]USW50974.1 Putative major facilitator superfamily, MFS transporter superfamily [Septoria linicola]